MLNAFFRLQLGIDFGSGGSCSDRSLAFWFSHEKDHPTYLQQQPGPKHQTGPRQGFEDRDCEFESILSVLWMENGTGDQIATVGVRVRSCRNESAWLGDRDRRQPLQWGQGKLR